MALIATPIILDVVEDARISAGKSESQMIYSGINNYCETIKLKKQMGTLTSEDVDCESKTTFTTEEISKMVNLGNSKVLENTYNGTLTYLKVESNGHIFILENGKFVEEGEIAFTPGECFTYEDITLVESFDINYDVCVTYFSNLYPEAPLEEVEMVCSDKNLMQNNIANGLFDINELEANNVVKNVFVERGITITGYNTECGGYDVVIPNSFNGKNIINIGMYAFSNNQLTNVTIPDSVITIDGSAFDSNQLTSVTIPNSVTTIGFSAFSNNQLTSVTIGNNVTTIGIEAFVGNQLTSVTIGNSVATIGDTAFAGNQLTNITIPDSVIHIGSYAFEGNQLKNVIIPDSVTTIGDSAFRENQLTSVTIGNSVIIIGKSAFSNNQLTSVTIPDSVITIGDYVFYKNQLTNVAIGNSVTTIGEDAFSYNQLTSINLPNSISAIGTEAFRNNKLASLDLSNLTDIQSISSDAFKCNLITPETFIGINEYNYDYFDFSCPPE